MNEDRELNEFALWLLNNCRTKYIGGWVKMCGDGGEFLKNRWEGGFFLNFLKNGAILKIAFGAIFYFTFLKDSIKLNLALIKNKI